jgi:hypothetical protein
MKVFTVALLSTMLFATGCAVSPTGRVTIDPTINHEKHHSDEFCPPGQAKKDGCRDFCPPGQAKKGNC